MTEDELCSIIDREEANSIGYFDTKLADQRRTAMEYYYGEPFGNEVDGRSSFVSRDVADTIEWILPALLKIFTASDDVVKFEPQGPEDEGAAQQATDYINYIFNRQNNGFVTLYSFFKDALLQKNGFVKIYWDEYTKSKVEEYENLDPMALTMVVQDYQNQGYEVEILEQEQEEDGSLGVKIRLNDLVGKVCIDPVPPDEIRVSKNADWDLQKARYVGHIRRMTASELREMGIKNVDTLELAPADDWNQERWARFSYDQSDAQFDDETSEATRVFEVVEAYLLVDWDGDGIAERRRVMKSGNQILEGEEGPINEEIDCVPIVTCTPIIIPHKLYGLSVADLVMDLQLLKSTIIRQILDNMYLTTSPRMMALDGMVNIDDLLTVRPGGIVRVKTFDAVKPLPVQFFGAPAFNMLEYVDTVRENRTGVTRYNQGIDANSLNKTATGINNIMSAAQQRIELIARIFAETGVKQLFWAILEMVCKYERKQRVVRLNNKWVQVDPREWSSRFDMSVNVGLGTGSKDQVLQGVMLLGQIQQQIAGAGMSNIVSPQNIYNLAHEAAENVFPKKGEKFFTDPQGQPPPPPQPDPKLQVAMQKAQMQSQDKRDLKAIDFLTQVAQMHVQGQNTDQQTKIQAAQAASDHQKMMMDQNFQREMKQTDQNFQQQSTQSQWQREDAMRASDEQVNQLVQSIQALAQQQAQIAQQLGQGQEALQQAVGQVAKVMSAKKKIITNEQGDPVGVEPILE